MKDALWIVYALFRAKIRKVDQARRAALRKQLLKEMNADAPDDGLDETMTAMSLIPVVNNYPPPSNDQTSWWQDSST